jgi:hypothetical protein
MNYDDVYVYLHLNVLEFDFSYRSDSVPDDHISHYLLPYNKVLSYYFVEVSRTFFFLYC